MKFCEKQFSISKIKIGCVDSNFEMKRNFLDFKDIKTNI
jgi:hypothetical protein